MRYVALLRGINVGGNNTVSMAELRVCFEQLGFTDVSTYINSGNVFFTTTETDEPDMISQIEHGVQNTFGFLVRTTVISAIELQKALAAAPAWWGDDPAAKHNAIFVIPPAQPKDIMAEVGTAKPEYERVAASGHVIFWSAPLATFGRTRWSKIVGTRAYQDITIRSANTTRKLLELAGT